MSRGLFMGMALGAVLAATHVNAQERVALRGEQVSEQGGGLSMLPSKMRVPMESRTIRNAPYSAEVVTESVQVLADGNRIVRKTTGRVYRDSQGRTRREDDRESGNVGSVLVSDPVANVSFSLDPGSRTAWKTGFKTALAIATAVPPAPLPAPLDPAELDRLRSIDAKIAVAAGARTDTVEAPSVRTALVRMGTPGHYDEKTEKLPARNIEGVMAEGTRVTRTIPAGAVGNEQPIVSVTEEWRSPELQVLVLTRTSDPRTGESTYKLLSINRSEPNQSWFEVPADYTVRESGVNRLEAVRK